MDMSEIKTGLLNFYLKSPVGLPPLDNYLTKSCRIYWLLLIYRMAYIGTQLIDFQILHNKSAKLWVNAQNCHFITLLTPLFNIISVQIWLLNLKMASYSLLYLSRIV